MKKQNKKQRHTGRKPCEDRGRSWRDAAASQGLLIDSHHQKLVRHKETSSPIDFRSSMGPTVSSMSDFWPLEL